MYYNKNQITGCSPQLQALLWQQDRIKNTTNDSQGLDLALTKIIRLAREEKQAFVYISALYDMLYLQTSTTKSRKAIQYAELFLGEGRVIFENALPMEHGDSDFRENYISCFELIGNVYMDFYQISSKKMEQFFSLYQESMYGYGEDILFREMLFYECRLRWEIMCRNTEAVKKIYKYHETLPLGGMCYVCANIEMNQARILLGDLNGALAHSAAVISENIPTEAQDRYEHCENASAYYQYITMFEDCLFCGRMDLIDSVILLAYNEILLADENVAISCSDALIYALYGKFVRWQDCIEEACERINDQKLYAPYDHMYTCLKWMTYFKLLYRSGVMRTAFPTEKPILLEVDSAGAYNVFEIATYFEQIADGIGMQFEKSRDQFHYVERKRCFQMLMEMHFTPPQ